MLCGGCPTLVSKETPAASCSALPHTGDRIGSSLRLGRDQSSWLTRADVGKKVSRRAFLDRCTPENGRSFAPWRTAASCQEPPSAALGRMLESTRLDIRRSGPSFAQQRYFKPTPGSVFGIAYGRLSLRANQRIQTRRAEHRHHRRAVRVFDRRRPHRKIRGRLERIRAILRKTGQLPLKTNSQKVFYVCAVRRSLAERHFTSTALRQQFGTRGRGYPRYGFFCRSTMSWRCLSKARRLASKARSMDTGISVSRPS
jgi:hypothetical protein